MNEKQVQTWLEGLKHPSEEYSPAPFWFFNDRFDPQRVREQLQDFTDKGVNAFVLHPRLGIPEEMEYLSESYFDAVRYIVRTAAELKMKVILYDEAQYPSGSAHGLVVRSNPTFASVGITIRKEQTGTVLCELSDGRYLVSDYSRGTIRGIHFGEDDLEEGAPPSADILNPAAVDRFLELTHEQYYNCLKEYFGNTVIGFFTDEPCILGRNAAGFFPWTPGFEEDFTKNGGKLAELEALFAGEKNPSVELYQHMIRERLLQVFYAKLSGWCEQHGIAFMGHPETSDDMEEELYFHVPGQDLIMRRVAPETGGISGMDSVQAKCSSDIALLLGRRRNSNECFGVCVRDQIPWYMTAQDMKWFTDWLAVRGVNLFIPHAFYYSIEGKRKEERPPDVGPNNIWWPYYRKFSDYMKRLSYLMTDIESTARVAVICRNQQIPVEEVADFYQRQIGFHYLPTALLSQCTLQEGMLCCGGLRFDTIFNPSDAPCGELPESLRQIHSAKEVCRLDFVTEAPCPGLRLNHVKKDGFHLYLLFLEVGPAIDTKVRLPLTGDIWETDLWEGTSRKILHWPAGGAAADSTEFALQMKYGETRLILVREADGPEEETQSGTPAYSAQNAAEEKQERRYLGDLTERFQEISQEKNVKTYRLKLSLEQVDGSEYFDVTGQEMAECWCNDSFAGVCFWNRYRFEIGPYLRTGENVITVRMTGNAANLYTDARIAFGLFPQP